MEDLRSEVQNAPLPQAANVSKLPTLLDSPACRPASRSGSRSGSQGSIKGSQGSIKGSLASTGNFIIGEAGKAYELSNRSPTPQQLAALRSTSASPSPLPPQRNAFHSRQNSRSGTRNQSRKFTGEGLDSRPSTPSKAGKTTVTDKNSSLNKSLLAFAVESAVADRPSFSDRESGASTPDSGRDLDAARENIMSEPDENVCSSYRPSFTSFNRMSGDLRCSGNFSDRASSFRDRGSFQSFGMFSNSQRDSLGERCSSFNGSVQSMGSAGSGLDMSDHDRNEDLEDHGDPLSNDAAPHSSRVNRFQYRRLPLLRSPQSPKGHMVASPRCLLAEARKRAGRGLESLSASKFMSAPPVLKEVEAPSPLTSRTAPDDNQPACHDERPESARQKSLRSHPSSAVASSSTNASEDNHPTRDEKRSESVIQRVKTILQASGSPHNKCQWLPPLVALSSTMVSDEKHAPCHEKQPMESVPNTSARPRPSHSAENASSTTASDENLPRCDEKLPSESASNKSPRPLPSSDGPAEASPGSVRLPETPVGKCRIRPGKTLVSDQQRNDLCETGVNNSEGDS